MKMLSMKMLGMKMLGMKMLPVMARPARLILDTLLPPHCLGCDTEVAADGQFCAPCFRRVNFVSAPFCTSCGVPLPYSGAAGTGGCCGACELAPPEFTSARSALRYDEMAKALLLPFKYADRTEAAQGIARLMARAAPDLLRAADVLVPVPLHKARLRQRRYNQSVLLAARLGRLSAKPVLPRALLRTRATQPLRQMGVAARRAELQGAIAVRPPAAAALRQCNVLLIDDIMTSGTTADACAAALLAAGAARVDVLTAARVPDPRLD